MAEWLVGDSSDFDNEQRKIFATTGSDSREIAVFRRNNMYYAFDNTCLHMGGPVGEGIIIGKVEMVLDDDKCLVMERFSTERMHLVCPWHGWEYDIETGAFAGDAKRRLRRYEAVERDGRVYVRT